MDLTVARFTALARSAPWRWTSLQFVLHPLPPGTGAAVRGWIGRPDRLRVETLDGTVLSAGRQTPQEMSRTPLTFRGAGMPVRYTAPLPPGARPAPIDRVEAPAVPVLPEVPPPPPLDADGLVTTPRARLGRTAYDVPIWQDYRWVAMFDPVELADGRDGHGGEGAPVTVDELTVVEHHGRPAWQAILRPTSFYDPRCSCCPLLGSAEADALEDNRIAERFPGFRFADAHRVRLDVATGVCVYTEEIGGDHPGTGHDLLIERVDGPVPSP